MEYTINREQLETLLKQARATGYICSVVFIQGYSSHSEEWQANAKAHEEAHLFANASEHRANGTLNSRAKDAKPYAKESRAIKFGGAEYLEHEDTESDDYLTFTEKLELGYIQPLDTNKLRYYLKWNGKHTLEQCQEWALANGEVYMRAYTDKATGEVFAKGDAKVSKCICKAVPFRRINVESIIKFRTDGDTYIIKD